MFEEERKTLVRSAATHTDTQRVKEAAVLRTERERELADAAEVLRIRERDPAQLARIFVPQKLLFEVFIGHDDLFAKQKDYDPYTVDANESWLNEQAFLQNTEYLPLLIEHTKNPSNKTSVNGEMIFPVENLAPYRPNVLATLITPITEVLFDHDDWGLKRVKENGESAIQLPTSKHRYGHVMVEKIGQAAYEQICEFYLASIREIAERKRIGGIIQLVEDRQPAEIPKTILAELTRYGDTLEDATTTYCAALKQASIIPRSNYEFMYKLGGLIMSIIDPDQKVPGLPLSRDPKRLAKACLAVIAQSQEVAVPN